MDTLQIHRPKTSTYPIVKAQQSTINQWLGQRARAKEFGGNGHPTTTNAKQFKDYYSKQANYYAKYRPEYPKALFDYLAILAPECQAAWDCATGNGQVALGLTPYFKQIYATDASEEQISRAFCHPKIKYSVASAEKVGLADKSIDLITVGQAVHWFDLEKFYQEVQRVAKPGAIIALWGYWSLQPPQEESLAKVCNNFLTISNQYLPEETKLILQKYQTIPFPFYECKAPSLNTEQLWNMEEYIGLLKSICSIQKTIEVHGEEIILEFSDRLAKAWGDPQKKILFQWPLHMRVGRVSN